MFNRKYNLLKSKIVHKTLHSNIEIWVISLRRGRQYSDRQLNINRVAKTPHLEALSETYFIFFALDLFRINLMISANFFFIINPNLIKRRLSISLLK